MSLKIVLDCTVNSLAIRENRCRTTCTFQLSQSLVPKRHGRLRPKKLSKDDKLLTIAAPFSTHHRQRSAETWAGQSPVLCCPTMWTAVVSRAGTGGEHACELKGVSYCKSIFGSRVHECRYENSVSMGESRCTSTRQRSPESSEGTKPQHEPYQGP